MKEYGVKFHHGIPDSDLLPIWFPKGGLLVLDDLMEERRQQQTGLGSFHQRFPPSKHHCDLFIARHVSTR